MWNQIMTKIVKWLDPKFDQFRKKPSEAPKYAPKTLEEFIDVMRRTPKTVLSSSDRAKIAAVMSFNDRTVKDLMIPRSQMVFVRSDEVLGPLVLDKLYKSGFTDFPVIDAKEKVKGVIHTEALNALEIKKTDRAEKYLDKNVSYLKTSDSLGRAVDEIKRTNSYFFLVTAADGSLVGFFTIDLLLNYLLND